MLNRSKRSLTPKQREITDLLRPYVGDDVLPWGIFSRIARETSVTPAYVSQLYHALRAGE